MTSIINSFGPTVIAVFVFAAIVFVTALSRFATTIAELGGLLHRMSAPQRLVTFAIVGAAAILVIATDAIQQAAHERIIRDQLRLPESVAITEFESRNRGRGHRETIEAIIRFSDTEFAEYEAIIADADQWRPIPFAYHRENITPLNEPGAYVWQPDNHPTFAGKHWVRWGHLTRDQPSYGRNRRYLCIAAKAISNDAGGSSRAALPAKQPTHVIRNCADFDRTESTIAYLLAELDYDRKSLRVIVN